MQVLTLSSNDICTNEDKSKITTEHVLKALEEMEFDFGSKLQEFIAQHRLDESAKKARKEPPKDSSSNADTEKKDDSSTSVVPDVDMDEQKDDVDDQNDGDDKEGDE